MPSAPRIFISYRRADSEVITGRIHDRLVNKYGIENVFLDVDSGNIPAGEDFREVLSSAVNECNVMLVVIGQKWVDIREDNNPNLRRLDNPDDFVRIEVMTGLEHDNILIIPVLVGNANMPASADLPDVISKLAFRNAHRVRGNPDFHHDMTLLIGRIDQHYDAIEKTGRGSSFRRGLLVMAFALLLLVVIALALILTSQKPLQLSPVDIANQRITQTADVQIALDQTRSFENSINAIMTQYVTQTYDANATIFAYGSATIDTYTETPTETPTVSSTPTENFEATTFAQETLNAQATASVPTSTPQPTITPIPLPTNTYTPTYTFTPTLTSTPNLSLTQTAEAAQRAQAQRDAQATLSAINVNRWTGADSLPTNPLECPGQTPISLGPVGTYDGGSPTNAPDLAGKAITLIDVPKLIGIGYFDEIAKGMQDAAKELGNVTVKTDGPTDADVNRQITFIDNAITSGVNGVLFAANDPVAISPVLKKALDAGIHVVGYEADSQPDAREWFVLQSTFNGIAKTLIDDMVAEKGDAVSFAILTSTFTAPNQARWIAEMQAYQEKCYPNMKWLETVEAQQDSNLSLNQATSLINKYGDQLTGLFAMTSPASPSAADAVSQAKACSKIGVVGLGTVNTMKSFIKKGCVKSVVLWNPVDLGYAAVYVMRAVVDGKLKPGDTSVEAGKLGTLQVINGSEVLLGPAFTFTKDNIDGFDF